MDSERAEDLHAELGYRLTGAKEVRQREWFALRGDPDEAAPTPRAFAKLVESLRNKKYWRAKSREQRQAIHASRRRWADEHRAAYLAIVRRRNAKVKATPRLYAKKIAAQKARRDQEKRRRREATVYTCQGCGATWCPAGDRLPCRTPKWCSNRCRLAFVRSRAFL